MQSVSRSVSQSSRRSGSTSPHRPSQTYHPSLLPHGMPSPALVDSIASASHYSGAPEAKRATSLSGEGHGHQRRESSALEIREDHHRVLEDVKELFCARPTPEIFERRWRRDAVFEDPLSYCEGFEEYAPQWYAMPKLFSKSETLSSRVMSSTKSPNRIVYSQTQEYTFKLVNYKKTVRSIVAIDLDENEKITKFADQWDGKDLGSKASLFRRLNAKVVPYLVHVPKSSLKKQD